MGVPNPILNCRAPIEVKESLDLLARWRQTTAGVLMRRWVEERLLSEVAMEKLHSVGFVEVTKRLNHPTYETQATESLDDEAVQTS